MHSATLTRVLTSMQLTVFRSLPPATCQPIQKKLIRETVATGLSSCQTSVCVYSWDPLVPAPVAQAIPASFPPVLLSPVASVSCVRGLFWCLLVSVPLLFPFLRMFHVDTLTPLTLQTLPTYKGEDEYHELQCPLQLNYPH